MLTTINKQGKVYAEPENTAGFLKDDDKEGLVVPILK